jgi:tetratricopeptide (TPR) repeat protein
MNTLRLSLALSLAATLSACASLEHRFAFLLPHRAPPMVPIIPVQTTLVSSSPADEGEYLDAKKAIDRREYAVALDLLFAARERKPDDVRVFNAMGVVYDKLGRFDVSTRYYAQAQALDPASLIVAQNMAYSAALQQAQARIAAEPHLALLATPTVKPQVARPAQASSPVIWLATPAAQRELTLARPGITGHPLQLVNASGRASIAEPVRVELARRGWTAPRSAELLADRIQPTTEIQFAREDEAVAQALAKTLPVKVQLTACRDSCQGVRLVLGADAAAWPIAGLRGAPGRRG